MSLTSWSRTTAPASVALVRLLVGSVFVSEGVQKFLFPVALGAGRFARIGIPVEAAIIGIFVWLARI